MGSSAGREIVARPRSYRQPADQLRTTFVIARSARLQARQAPWKIPNDVLCSASNIPVARRGGGFFFRENRERQREARPSRAQVKSKEEQNRRMASDGTQHLAPEELERLIFFEAAKEQAKAEVKKNPKDVQALVRWGGALLELAHLKQGHESIVCIEEAVERIEQALKIDPRKHEALWCLGNAYTSQGFLHASVEKAQDFFDRASDCFRKACKEDPNNEVYKKALEMNSKAPQLHAQIQKQLQQQQEASMQEQAKLQSASSDFLYDVAGWAILVGLGVGLVVLSSLQKPK